MNRFNSHAKIGFRELRFLVSGVYLEWSKAIRLVKLTIDRNNDL